MAEFCSSLMEFFFFTAWDLITEPLPFISASLLFVSWYVRENMPNKELCKLLHLDMIFRKAELFDVQQMQTVRNRVRENILSDPAVVPDRDVAYYICERGQGWVCVLDYKVIGFSIVDLVENSVWALFVDPQYEGQGVGKKLLELMLDWYFTHTHCTIKLGTAPYTRASTFYFLQGWESIGGVQNEEQQFTLDYSTWLRKKTRLE